MKSTQDTYLAWRSLRHAEGCRRPAWEVAFRTDETDHRDGVFSRFAEEPVKHSCPDVDCRHDNSYEKLAVRVVCRCCGSAHLLTGEYHSQHHTTTARIGYGLPPRKASGLWLWPGDPWLRVLRDETGEPFDFLVTAGRVEQVTQADMVGQITQSRGKRGAVIWTAAAVPTPDGPYGAGLGMRWAHAKEGFKTPAAAAKWIAIELDAVSGTGGAG